MVGMIYKFDTTVVTLVQKRYRDGYLNVFTQNLDCGLIIGPSFGLIVSVIKTCQEQSAKALHNLYASP